MNLFRAVMAITDPGSVVGRLMQTVEELQALADADAVADLLRNNDIKGDRGYRWGCPLAVYLARKAGVEVGMVGVSRYAIELESTEYTGVNPEVRIDLSSDSPIYKFIEAFDDDNRYSDLTPDDDD